MRLFFALLLVFSLALLPSAFAAQKKGAAAPAKSSERIYLESEVTVDEMDQFATDADGIPVNGTIQNFYPNGRLAWETQWTNGRLHGITKGYHENRKLREETTWVAGRLHGPAKWYDDSGRLLRETVYEDNRDLNAPDPDKAADAERKEGAPADDANTDRQAGAE